MQLSTLFLSIATLQGAIATPVVGSAAEVETRDLAPRAPALGDLPWPKMPTLNSKKMKKYMNSHF